jgi:rSAM/selenodomain-associated transferase 2
MVAVRNEPLVTIVIPVLNDTPALAALLDDLQPYRDQPAVEIVVVDGGKAADPTLERLRARHADVTWLRSVAGRGAQMNHGARHARGRWLLFLHADTRLGTGWLDELGRLEGLPGVAGGSFRFALDSRSPWARWIERGVEARVRLFDLPYGDQALFATRGDFNALGGFREMPLMEDVDFVRRLRRRGRLARVAVAALTSARRWEQDGWVRRSVENVMLTLLFLAGLPPERLADRYHRRRGMHAGAGQRVVRK